MIFVKLLRKIQNVKAKNKSKLNWIVKPSINLSFHSLFFEFFITFFPPFISKHIAYKSDNDFNLWTIPWCTLHGKNVCILNWLPIHLFETQCNRSDKIRLSFWFLYDQASQSVLSLTLSILFLFFNQVQLVAKIN